MVAPDASAIEYVYDAAHRLTDLRDGSGNSVHFTLDNMGNVIRQETRGPRGELVTAAQRTFDALNRLKKEQRDDQDPGTSFAYDRRGNTSYVNTISTTSNRLASAPPRAGAGKAKLLRCHRQPFERRYRSI